MPVILAIETATAVATVSLARTRSGAIRVWWDWQGGARNLQTSLFTAIQEGYAAIQATPAETSVVVVGQGPGSFTGVKLALGIAKTYGQSIEGCQVFAVPSYYGALPPEPEPGSLIAWTVPSTRSSSYLVGLRPDEEGALEEVLPLGDFPNETIRDVLAELGSTGLLLRESSVNLPSAGSAILPEGWVEESVAAEHAEALLDLYMAAGEAWEPDDPLTLAPTYIRPPQATLVSRPRLFEAEGPA